MNETQVLAANEVAKSESMYVVFDVPVTTTTDEAARLINEPYERGFYIHAIAPW